MILTVPIFAVLAVSAQQSAPGSIQIRDGFAIGGVAAAGRLPVFADAVLEQIVKGSWKMPKAGDSVATMSGGTAKWRHVEASSDGSFRNLGNGYFAASVEVSSDGVMDLDASGDSLVYVNGEPRAGDPYANGYFKIPVALHRGSNTFVFSVGRGGLKARLLPIRSEVQLETGDLTTPDIVVGGPKDLWAGIVVLNNSARGQLVSLATENGTGQRSSTRAYVPPMTLRKVPIHVVVPEGELGKSQKYQVEVVMGRAIDKATIALEVKTAGETRKETFVSDIDGSLQYYGVNPSQHMNNSNALVLSLHGAGVEGVGQAAAYSHKDWCTLVAPTNRRPYGFDWEDIGRLDALEVLDIAKRRFPHDKSSVHLTGHSMGGHGTWSIGTLYPDLFASIAPSAGWVSFWSYAGGYQPRNATPVESTLLRSMAPSDTLARVDNTLEEKVYILHGDADDNVPVEQARQMKSVLSSIHADFEYHEQPGAGHWWGLPNLNAACVDWPGIFDQIKSSKLINRDSIEFVTPSPAVSSHDEWVTVLQQEHPLIVSRVKIGSTIGTTANVAALRLDRAFDSLNLDGQSLGKLGRGVQLIKSEGKWKEGKIAEGERRPELSGPFKNIYRNKFAFVVGTAGSPEENRWAANKARFDAETFQYRGNGSVDIFTDTQYRSSWGRNVVLYGNASTNRAWKSVFGSSPIQVTRNEIKVGEKTFAGPNLASMFVYPHKAGGKWFMAGAICGTGLEGCRTTDRLAIFTSGVAFPDWTVLSTDVLRSGAKGLKGCGFFGNDWSLARGEAAWN